MARKLRNPSLLHGLAALAVEDAANALDVGRLWQSASAAYGTESPLAKQTAIDTSTELWQVHYGRNPIQPKAEVWNLLSIEYPDVYAKLVALKTAAQVAWEEFRDTNRSKSWDSLANVERTAHELQRVIEGPSPKHRRTSSNVARDEWLYDQYVIAKDTKEILIYIKTKGWDRLDSAPAIRRAVLRFCEKRGYPEPVRGQMTNHRLGPPA